MIESFEPWATHEEAAVVVTRKPNPWAVLWSGQKPLLTKPIEAGGQKISGGLSKSRNLGPFSQGLPNAQLLASRWEGGFGVLKDLKLRPFTGRL